MHQSCLLFSVFYSALTSWEPCWPGTLPLPGLISRDSKERLSGPFICKAASPKATSPTSPFPNFHMASQYCPCPKSPRPGARQLDSQTSPLLTQSLLGFFKLSNPDWSHCLPSHPQERLRTRCFPRMAPLLLGRVSNKTPFMARTSLCLSPDLSRLKHRSLCLTVLEAGEPKIKVPAAGQLRAFLLHLHMAEGRRQ